MSNKNSSQEKLTATQMLEAQVNTLAQTVNTLTDANLELAAKVEDLEKRLKSLGNPRKGRGRSSAQPVRDKVTNLIYGSKAKAGMAVASEYGLDPENSWVWYEVIRKDPARFEPAPVDGAKEPQKVA